MGHDRGAPVELRREGSRNVVAAADRDARPLVRAVEIR